VEERSSPTKVSGPGTGRTNWCDFKSPSVAAYKTARFSIPVFYGGADDDADARNGPSSRHHFAHMALSGTQARTGVSTPNGTQERQPGREMRSNLSREKLICKYC
jgi:hypothetical protein